MRPPRHYGRARWWTWAEFDTIVQHAARGNVEVSTRRNRRAVRCRVERHTLCAPDQAVMLWCDGQRVGFCCPACIGAVQVAMQTHRLGY